MKIIKPYAEVIESTEGQLKHIERCGRIAYKSENAITEDSYKNFVKHLAKMGHLSVLEHGNYIYRLSEREYQDLKSLYKRISFDSLSNFGLSARLRFSGFSDGIISGNLRAWYDFFRAAYILEEEKFHLTLLANLSLYEVVKEVFGKEFIKSANDEDVKQPLTKADLTPDEQLIHWTETVHFVCSRAISHELVRHRALSPTQESQRYCNYSKDKFGNDVTVIEPAGLNELEYHIWKSSTKASTESYLTLLERGAEPQKAREVLPNSTKTEIVLTGTLGEWEHFFKLRTAPDAHPEMRRLTIPLLKDKAFELIAGGKLG